MTSAFGIKLGLLEVGQNLPELVAEQGTMAEWFVPFLGKAGRPIEYRTYPVYRGEMPRDVRDCSAWLITGSAAGVHDDLPWLSDLRGFVLAAAKVRPMVGICFGHQLLHHVYGGRVVTSDKGWGVGVHHYQVRERRTWMRPPADALRMIASHRDQVIDPAPNSRTLAGSEFCPVAVSEFAENVLSIQPHPELKPGVARRIFELRREEQGHDTTDAALLSLDEPVDDLIAAHWVMNFLEQRVVGD